MEYDILETQSRAVDEGFKNATLARKYKEITDEHGPSQQLIDFINFDGMLGDEVGLEGFSNFSTTTQHEILLSKLNPDSMESMAMEGFGEFVKKYRHWLLGAGALQKIFIGGLSWGPLVALGVAGIIMKRAETVAATLRDFNNNRSSIDTVVAVVKKTLSNLPKDGNHDKWNSIKEIMETSSGKLDHEVGDSAEDHFKKVKDGGWTSAEFISAAKWYDSVVKEIDYIQKKFSEDLDKPTIDNVKDAKVVNEAIFSVYKTLKDLHAWIKYMKSDLDKVAKAFGRKTEEA